MGWDGYKGLPGTFSLSINKFVEKAKLNPTLVMRKLALDMGTEIIESTPVLTGRLRANWHIALGSPDTKTTLQVDSTGQKTINDLGAALEGVKDGQDIYIINNLVYAVPIEYGHSKKAPYGMVRRTVKRYREFLEKAIEEVKSE